MINFSAENTATALAVLATLLEDEEVSVTHYTCRLTFDELGCPLTPLQDGGHGFQSILQLTLKGCRDALPLVRTSRMGALSTLAKWNGCADADLGFGESADLFPSERG